MLTIARRERRTINSIWFVQVYIKFFEMTFLFVKVKTAQNCSRIKLTGDLLCCAAFSLLKLFEIVAAESAASRFDLVC